MWFKTSKLSIAVIPQIIIHCVAIKLQYIVPFPYLLVFKKGFEANEFDINYNSW